MPEGDGQPADTRTTEATGTQGNGQEDGNRPVLPKKTARPAGTEEPEIGTTPAPAPEADQEEDGQSRRNQTPEPEGDGGETSQPTAEPEETAVERVHEEPKLTEGITFGMPNFEWSGNWVAPEDVEAIIATTTHTSRVIDPIHGYGCAAGPSQIMKAFAVVDRDGEVTIMRGAAYWNQKRNSDGTPKERGVRKREAPIMKAIEWSSSDTQVIDVMEVKVGAGSTIINMLCGTPGTTTITAEINGTSASVEVRLRTEPERQYEVLERNCVEEEGVRTAYRNAVWITLHPWPEGLASHQRMLVVGEDTGSELMALRRDPEFDKSHIEEYGYRPAFDDDEFVIWVMTKSCQSKAEQEEFIEDLLAHEYVASAVVYTQ